VLILTVAQPFHQPFVKDLVRVLFRQKGLKAAALAGEPLIPGSVQ